MFEFGEKQIKALLDAIFAGSITNHKLPQNLYLAIADYLKKGVYKGYGFDISSLTKEVGKRAPNVALQDLELLAELRTNIYMFSAAKTYQQVREMSSALIDERGVVVPFAKFKDKAKQTFDLYNDSYLKTEYDTAVGQAQNAMSWRQIEKDAEVLPLLEYDAIIDKFTSDICRPLNGLVAPVSDPVWKKIMPLNHFNCRCIVRQRRQGEVKETSAGKKAAVFQQVTGKMNDVFKMNAGQDGYVFKKDHPYFVVPKEDKEFAKKNFGLKIPKTDNQ
jgi:SPP1 gp7 family putative phage head morphogenesis protein